MFWTVTQSLLTGLATTFEIFILTLIFALPLGLVLAFGLLSKFKPLQRLVQILVWIIRGTPLMLQLIIIFYGPGLWLHTTVWSGNESGRITATVVAFVINYACYFSVIFRGGIEGVPAGQREAGQVLGMTKHQIFFKITLLQMIKRVVPPMSNEIITLVKDTSLARIIAAYELTFAGAAFMKSDGLTWPLFYTGTLGFGLRRVTTHTILITVAARGTQLDHLVLVALELPVIGFQTLGAGKNLNRIAARRLLRSSGLRRLRSGFGHNGRRFDRGLRRGVVALFDQLHTPHEIHIVLHGVEQRTGLRDT